MTTNGNGLAHLTKPQQWSVLGLLAAVILGGGYLLFQTSESQRKSQETQSAAIVTAVRELGAENRQTRDVLAGLLIELKLQAQQNGHVHAEYSRERDRAVEALKDAIKNIPQLVVDRIGFRKQ
jgi:hypothetical protein